jgi:hypothetical protein
LERKLTTPRDLLVSELAYILRGNERIKIFPKGVTLKNLRNPNHLLLMGKLRKGKR